jgi:predicted esterase
MESDVVPNNPSRINYEEVDQSIHLDYPQLMRAATYVNEIMEKEIANGISPEKIIISGYSQGGLLTLATALTSKYKLGGFISLCGLLPRQEKLLKITQDKNKETPTLIINNSEDY